MDGREGTHEKERRLMERGCGVTEENRPTELSLTRQNATAETVPSRLLEAHTSTAIGTDDNIPPVESPHLPLSRPVRGNFTTDLGPLLIFDATVWRKLYVGPDKRSVVYIVVCITIGVRPAVPGGAAEASRRLGLRSTRGAPRPPRPLPRISSEHASLKDVLFEFLLCGFPRPVHRARQQRRSAPAPRARRRPAPHIVREITLHSFHSARRMRVKRPRRVQPGQRALRARSVLTQQRPRSTRARTRAELRRPRRYAPSRPGWPALRRLDSQTKLFVPGENGLRLKLRITCPCKLWSSPCISRTRALRRCSPAPRAALASCPRARSAAPPAPIHRIGCCDRSVKPNKSPTLKGFSLLMRYYESGCGRGPAGDPDNARALHSLSAVTRLYHSLFAQHEHALRPLAERHRVDSPAPAPAPRVPSVLDARWFHELTDLAQFYDEDEVLHDRLHALRIGAAPTCTLHGVTAASSFGTYCHEFASNITSKTVEESGPTAVEEEWPDMSACPGECVSDETPHATRAALSRTAGPAPAASSSSASADAGRAPRDVGLVIRLAMPSTAESPTPAV
ncbi:hypothetical protein EVAR_27420_1 [Eumeta japonica]|uniref:Uncharacterized protein n=1 Tax=Eumeta variegata TaxID=151549 RepID=A0A4C1VKY4_EUMVA|nr:hypothetical protein EVAR_27420_1 [Eumeta japonica]